MTGESKASRKTDKLFRRIEELASEAVEGALANPRPRSPEEMDQMPGPYMGDGVALVQMYQTLMNGKYQGWTEEDSETATRLKRVASILIRWSELSDELEAKHPGDPGMQMFERMGLHRSFIYQIGWLLNGASPEDAATQVLDHSKAPVMSTRRAQYPDALSLLASDFEFPGE